MCRATSSTTDDDLTRRRTSSHARSPMPTSAITGAPRSIVPVIFWTTGAGNAYVGGRPRAGTHLQGSVRAGRDVDTISTLLHELAAAVGRATGAVADDVTVALRETPTHLVLEGGRVVGEPGRWPSAS